MAAIWSFGVMETVIIPKYVKYRNEKKLMKKSQKNLAAVHSNDTMAYTMTL